MELLEGEKLNLRKQLIERFLSHKPNKAHSSTVGSHDPTQSTGRDDVIATCDGVDGEGVWGDTAVVEQRTRKVRELEQRCEAERRQTELAQRDRESVKRELVQAQEQVPPLTTPYLL